MMPKKAEHMNVLNNWYYDVNEAASADVHPLHYQVQNMAIQERYIDISIDEQ